MCVYETGCTNLPLTSFITVSSSLLPISSWTPLILMMTANSGRMGNEAGLSNITARRKLAACVAEGKQIEGRRAHGLLSTWRKRRELGREREREGNIRKEHVHYY